MAASGIGMACPHRSEPRARGSDVTLSALPLSPFFPPQHGVSALVVRLRSAEECLPRLRVRIVLVTGTDVEMALPSCDRKRPLVVFGTSTLHLALVCGGGFFTSLFSALIYVPVSFAGRVKRKHEVFAELHRPSYFSLHCSLSTVGVHGKLCCSLKR